MATSRSSVLSTVALALALTVPLPPRMAAAQRPGLPSRPGAPPAQQNAPQNLSLLQLPNVLLAKLGVTPEQKQALETVRGRQATDLQARPGGKEVGADPQGALLRSQALERRSEGEALAVLTPDQRRQFAQMQADYRLLTALGRPAMALLNVSQLTAEQKRELQAVVREMQEKRGEALRKLSREATQTEIRDALKGVEKETEKAVQEKLTSRQAKEFVVALPEIPPPGRYRSAVPR